MTFQTIEQQREASISNILVRAANPNWLPQEERLAPKGKTLEEYLEEEEREELAQITEGKIKTVRSYRDMFRNRVNDFLGINLETFGKRFQNINNYYELDGMLLSDEILNDRNREIVEETSRRVQKELPSRAPEVPLYEVINRIEKRRERGGELHRKRQKVDLGVYSLTHTHNDLVYLQQKDKRPEKIADKIAREIINEEHEASLCRQHFKEIEDRDTPHNKPSIHNIEIGDIAGFMYVTKWGHRVSDDTALFANPEDPTYREKPNPMDLIVQVLKTHAHTRIKRTEENNYEPEVIVLNPKDTYRYSPEEERINAVKMKVGDKEAVSVYVKDLYNALIDERGPRGHPLYDHRRRNGFRDLEGERNLSSEEQKNITTYKERTLDFLFSLPLWRPELE